MQTSNYVKYEQRPGRMFKIASEDFIFLPRVDVLIIHNTLFS